MARSYEISKEVIPKLAGMSGGGGSVRCAVLGPCIAPLCIGILRSGIA
jgi:hypothetical protein